MDSRAFLSRDGFAPELWGPGLWLLMTIVAANYPLQPTSSDATHYFTFYYNLQYILPCRSCREEYRKMILGKVDPSLKLTLGMFRQKKGARLGSSRKAVFRWIVQVHNVVNRRLGKRKSLLDISVSEWARRYARLRGITRRQALARSLTNKPLKHSRSRPRKST